MSFPSSPPPPACGTLPVCVDSELVRCVLHALPRPRPDDPPDRGRRMIARALALLREAQPSSALQATLAAQAVIAQLRALQAWEIAAASETEPAQMIRAERHALTLTRGAAAVERQVRRAPAGEVTETWDYDLAELEAAWRAPPTAPALTAAGPAKPPPARVPLWKQHGRTFMHEIDDEELDELVQAKERGEPLEEPPYAPNDPALTYVPKIYPKRPYKYWGDMTMEERRERYGYRTEEEIAAARPAEEAAKAAHRARMAELAKLGGPGA